MTMDGEKTDEAGKHVDPRDLMVSKTNVNVFVRAADPHDEPALTHMARALIEEAPALREWPFEERVFHEFLTRPSTVSCRIACDPDTGVVMGAIMFDVVPVHIASGEKCISDVAFYVQPEYRGRGVARALLREMEFVGQRTGCVLASFGSGTGMRTTAERIALVEDYHITSVGFAKALSGGPTVPVHVEVS